MPNIRIQNQESRGFTLIELMVTIAIVAIISAIGIVNYSQAQVSARDSKRKQDLTSIQTALQLYYQTKKEYPIKTVESTSPGSWDILVNSATENYINRMPDDPTNDKTVIPKLLYSYSSDGTTYTICTNLENKYDPVAKAAACNINSVEYNYIVVNP